MFNKRSLTLSVSRSLSINTLWTVEKNIYWFVSLTLQVPIMSHNLTKFAWVKVGVQIEAYSLEIIVKYLGFEMDQQQIYFLILQSFYGSQI